MFSTKSLLPDVLIRFLQSINDLRMFVTLLPILQSIKFEHPSYAEEKSFTFSPHTPY